MALVLASLCGVPAGAGALYGEADFATVRKFDAHVHANTHDHVFLDVAVRDNFELLSINVDYPDFPPLAEQAQIAHELQAADPARFHFATTFSMHGFGAAGWEADTERAVDAELARGALAVKIWKNVGMVEKDGAGHFIFIDDPRFDGLIAHLESHGVPLIAHQGEPRNCWLPLEAMTTDNDRSYFRDHPEYYMYRHPEMPGYEQLMSARDRFVSRHPRLNFIGAHLASLEWSVDRIARFLDAHPHATVDMAARMSELQYQSNRDYARVRRFLIRYQDRILYGTDLTQDPPDPAARAQNPPRAAEDFAGEADAVWRADWRYLATTEEQHVAAINADVRGLGLPRPVIDKIYYQNARRVFGLH